MTVSGELLKRGEEEARSLSDLLEQQRSRIAKAAKDFDPNQLTLDLVPGERREREADRRHWEAGLRASKRELRDEPQRFATPTKYGRIGWNRSGLFISGRLPDERHGHETLSRPGPRMARPCSAGRSCRRPGLLKELGLSPLGQTPIDTGEVAELLGADSSKPALSDPWAFVGTSARLGSAACRRSAGRSAHSG